jgi:hypothetical protein
MPRHTKRLCSILGTSLIGLCLIASPAFAQGKGKKGKKSEEAAAPAAEEPSSVDALMEDATKEKAKPAEKKGKKGKKGKKEEAPPELSAEEKKAAEEKAAADQKAAEELAQTDEWEKPPEEEKPAQAEVKAPVVEDKAGDGRPISLGLLLGYGFQTDRSTDSLGSDPYGFGAKLRGGYTFDFMLYAGLYYAYYLGSSTTGGGRTSGISTTSASYMQFGAEVGYDWFVGPVIIRPSLEIGLAIAFSDRTGSAQSHTGFHLGPGMLVMVPIDDFFIGGDLRGSIVMGNGVSSVVASATAGLRF